MQRENGLIVYYPGGDGGAVESERATLQYNTIQTPKGGEYAVVLPDGSKVWLNALSSLRFPARFGDRERRVEVTGEAYFEIARVKNADGGNLPFFVAFKTASGKDAAIEVLGTRFNLNAYPDEQAVKATLIEGSVRIGMDGTLQTLKPGQQSSINANDVMTVVDGVDLFEAIAWKNGFFHFENADLKTVMRQLQRWYDVEVVFEGALNDTETFSGEIGRDLELSQVVKLLRQMDLNIRIENRKMMVSP
ncbi:hypothetical protein AWW69_04700 [Bacillus cereus]|nr:hypothetical protein AWW69_04700 [Bacillus cereus]